MRLQMFCLVVLSAEASRQIHSTANTIAKPQYSHDVEELRRQDLLDKDHPTLDPHTSSMTQQVERLFRTHTYEMSVLPSRDDEPVAVGVAVLVESISDISEVNMDLTFTLRIWKTWTDERLILNGEHDSIVLPSRLIDKLWVPDLFIVGSKKSFTHRTTVDNVMLRLYRNGTISYRAKITTTVACQMNLQNFPLDIENCSLAVQSLAYTDDEVVLKWMMNEDDDIFMNPKLVRSMPKFMLVHHRLHNHTVSAKQGGGKISRLSVSFELKRYLISVFFQSYFPAIIMVILAGLGTWLDPRSVPARVAMGITSVLTISTVITGLKSSLPKVSYLTAMDFYLWLSFLFVFSTVLEYCWVNYSMMAASRTEISLRKNKLSKAAREHTKFSVENGRRSSQFSTDSGIEVGKCHRSDIYKAGIDAGLHNYRKNTSPPKLPHVPVSCRRPERSKMSSVKKTIYIAIKHDFDPVRTDVVFRRLYFITFFMFNIAYWIYYVVSTQHGKNDDDE